MRKLTRRGGGREKGWKGDRRRKMVKKGWEDQDGEGEEEWIERGREGMGGRG